MCISGEAEWLSDDERADNGGRHEFGDVIVRISLAGGPIFNRRSTTQL
jgi:hypothetical protein